MSERINNTNPKIATNSRIRLPPSRATTFRQSEFSIENLINAMPNKQHRTIANICEANYKEEFLENVNIGGQARLVRAAKPTAGKQTELNKSSKCSRN
jgi:hypothetical protein